MCIRDRALVVCTFNFPVLSTLIISGLSLVPVSYTHLWIVMKCWDNVRNQAVIRDMLPCVSVCWVLSVRWQSCLLYTSIYDTMSTSTNETEEKIIGDDLMTMERTRLAAMPEQRRLDVYKRQAR